MSFKRIAYLLILQFVLFSCGGCGNDNNNSPEREVLNNDQTGVFNIVGTATFMDAATGGYHQFDLDSIYAEECYPDGGYYTYYPIEKNPDKYLKVAMEENESYVCLQTYRGELIREIQFPFNVTGASLSQDENYISILQHDSANSTEYSLEIYTVEGERISGVNSEAGKIRWLQDNRLIVSQGRKFHITYQNSTEIASTIDLDQYDLITQVEGDILDWSISPDESRILFTFEVDNFEHDELNMFIMGLDGSNLRVFATASEEADGSIVFYPLWSPDGNWVFIEAGAYVGFKPYKSTTMYLIPTNIQDEQFTLSTDEDVRSPEVRLFLRRHYLVGDPEEITSNGLAYSNLFWLPDSRNAAEENAAHQEQDAGSTDSIAHNH
jgi:hypothetical protein